LVIAASLPSDESGLLGNNLTHQIVILRFGDFALIKLARVQLFEGAKVIDIYLAIDLWGLVLCTALP
jgi:hypothetical protein